MSKFFPLVAKVDQLISKVTQGNLLSVGVEAPLFELLDQEGKPVALKSFRGKKVAIWFYPKADTPGCTAEACAFRDRMPNFSKRGVTVLGVSFDSPEANKAFWTKFQLTFPLLSDSSRGMSMAYGACKKATDRVASRIAYLIDEKGVIQKAYPSVNAAKFPEQLLSEV